MFAVIDRSNIALFTTRARSEVRVPPGGRMPKLR
jgi:hypothetical protein